MCPQRSDANQPTIRFLSFILHPSSFILFFFLALPAWCQPSLRASSLNSGGTNVAAGSLYSMQTTLGQSGGVGYSEWRPGSQRIAWGFQAQESSLGEAPRIITATVSDVNNNGLIQPGDQLVLTLDRSVIVTTRVLQASHFFLPVAGDSLGRTNFSVRLNPHNSRQIVLSLGGPTVHLVTSGTFTMSRRTFGSPSGIDFATSLPLGSVVSRDGIPATDGGVASLDDSGVDLEISLQSRTGSIGGAGGVVTVGSSADAAYRNHSIEFPAGALSKLTQFTMRAPQDNRGVIGAVWISSSDPTVQFGAPVHLWIEYREGDIDWEYGLLESNMRVFQLVENPPGNFHYELVPGIQLQSETPPLVPFRLTGKFDSTPRVVGVELGNLNPCGSVGTVGLFAGLPIETVDERTIHIKPGAGSGVVQEAGSVVLTPGSRGSYTLHKIEIPNYVLTTSGDPARLVMTVRTTVLAERWSQSGGCSFPSQSGAIFTVTVTDANGLPVQFTSPVHLTVQFYDRLNPALTDVMHFDGRLGVAANMRLCYDRAAGDAVDFAVSGAVSQTVDLVQNTVTVQNHVGLTGSDGRGTFGAIAIDIPTTPADHWQIYK
jgi:hypothetical protein